MASGKARNNKRSSGTSYTSTVTTIIFIALCVLGVWMLTSNSVIPPKITTSTPTTDFSSVAKNSHSTELANKKTSEAYGDNPGQLPEEAIKTHDHTQSKETNGNEKSQESEKYSGDEIKNDEESVLRKPDSVGSVVEENPYGLQAKESVEEEEKQKHHENQVSEESSMTQNQEVEEHVTTDHERTEKQEVLSNVRHGIEEKRQENHQQKGKQEIEEGISHDQIEHDEAVPLKSSIKNDNEASQQKPGTRRNKIGSSETQKSNSEHDSHSNVDNKKEEKGTQSNPDELLLGGESSGIPKESKESKKTWSTQADQSENQKERRKSGPDDQDGSIYGYTWQLCNVTAGTDYIPCLDNEKALKKLHTTRHFEHRERHCPEEAPTCLVTLPEGYKRPIEWPDIAWGKHTRVILDVGCGVASFGGFLFERDVLAMSLAPKDEHEAQVQFALERGIPAISAVMGSQRLPFPSRVFDIVHCARCRVPWHEEGGRLLLELNRILRPGGYFVWSATPVYQTLEEDVEIWKEMSALTKSMCWELVTIKKDKLNSVGAAIYHKPLASNECYEQRKQNRPPMCRSDDDPNAAWYVKLQSCMHRVPEEEVERGSRWPPNWPQRLQTPPYWLNKSQMGVYGKPAPDDFARDYEHWKRMVSKTYLSGLGISWDNVRNIMDMRAVYGGFAAALKDLKVWVMNVVNIDSPDTLPIIFERGLFGIYHDWCESFSTYPRSYDLLHADHLFSKLKKRCKIEPVMAEIDRIVRPGGKLIVRDESSTIAEVENLLKSLHWEVHLTFSKNQEGILSAQKSDWRPDSYAARS